jgi:lysophospholipase
MANEPFTVPCGNGSPDCRMGARNIHWVVTADGATIRCGSWRCDSGDARGSVLLLSGRKEFLEKYREAIADLNRRGFDVFSLDWRGQGLSQRLLPDRLKGHISSYDGYLEDLRAVWRELVQPAAVRPVVVMAHSMGAHVALRFACEHKGCAERLVLLSPMIDIAHQPCPRWLLRWLTALAVRSPLRTALVPGARGRNPYLRKFADNPLTADPVRFKVEVDAVGANPDLALGGMTFQWLAATLASIDRLKAPGYVDSLSIPVLMVGGGADRVVSARAQRRICARLVNCRLAVIAGARHEILMETDAVRTKFWELFDKFTDDLR